MSEIRRGPIVHNRCRNQRLLADSTTTRSWRVSVLREAAKRLRCVPVLRRTWSWLPQFLIATTLLVTACSSVTPTAPPEPTITPTEESVPPSQPQLPGDAPATPLPRHALDLDTRFERISIEQGLSQSSVLCILQDSKGFMWFGTWDGLNKYDGHEFTVYRHDPDDPNSLSDDMVRSLYEDQAGTIWVGTGDGGLNRFDRESEQFTYYETDPGDPYSLSHNGISSIHEDQFGTLWIGTYGGGLNRFIRESERFVRYRNDPRDIHSLSYNGISSIYEDQSGVLWVGTNGGGLNRFDRKNDFFIRYQNDGNDPYSLSHNGVSSIYEDRSGTLWIGTYGGGLNKFDRDTRTFTRYRNDPNDPNSLIDDVVLSICEDQTGILWIGTSDKGLDAFDRDTGQFIHHQSNLNDLTSLSSNSIRSVYEDRSGVVWIGTNDGGLDKFDRSTKRFAHYYHDPGNPNSLNDNDVFPIYEDRTGVLWIGTSAGLNRFDRDTGQFTHFQNEPDDRFSLSDNRVTSIHQDQSGALWIGTSGGGLNKLDRRTGRFTHYRYDPRDPNSLSGNYVFPIYEDRAGTLWIGASGKGLNRFDGETGRCIRYQHDPENLNSLSDNTVRAILEDQSGMLWIGTDNGLDMFDRETEQFVVYRHDPEDPNSLSDSFVLSVHESGPTTLWIGTNGGGLNRFDREKGIFTHYTEKDGLPNEVIYGILEDSQGFLWLSTNKGLSRFDPRRGIFKNYDRRDGLQSNEFHGGSSFKSNSGEMFFGGINGFNAFHPDSIYDNPFIPPIVLTSLSQGGEAVDVGKAIESVREVTFNWPTNFFEFEFAALSYVQPEKNQYAYMLEGLEDDWIYIETRRFGRYTNLPSGTYTLRMTGSNNDGAWNEEGISVTITVVPPFWGTWWFRGIVILALVGSVIGGYRLRVRNIEARSHELENQVKERTVELSRANELLKQEITERKRAEEALAKQAAETAVAAERSRLARDLHDAVTQTLFSASLIAEALPDIWQSDQVEGRQLLTEMRRLSRGALAEMRTLLLELRPAALMDVSLGELLQQLAEAVVGRKDVSVAVSTDGQFDFPSDVHVALYRIAQETLNNVVKHAHASQVTIGLHCSSQEENGETTVEMCITDDGCGFDPAGVPPDHLGLGIIQERAEAIGATSTIRSQPGQGTQVTIAWKG